MNNINTKEVNEITKFAEQLFIDGHFCCSEAVFRALKKGFKMSGAEELSALASGFCGGIGGTHGGTCGALTGGVLAIGLAFGRTDAQSPREGIARRLSAELYKQFAKEHTVSECSALLRQCEIENKEKKGFCRDLVKSAAQKTALLLSEELRGEEQMDILQKSKYKIMDWKEYLGKEKHYSFAGNVKVIPDFGMPQFERQRNIWIYLPPDYETETAKRYPVLYMHDGQNLFADELSYSGEWGVDDTLEEYFAGGKCGGIIVVGIENGGAYREEEYTPWKRLKEYTAFLTDTLKPFIDRSFRTKPEREYTGVAGSSYGGVASLFAGLTRQDVFSKVGGFSPSAWEWREKIGVDVLKESDMKVYLSVGAVEMEGDETTLKTARRFAKQAEEIYERLQIAGFGDDERKFFLDKNGKHSERTWRKHFAQAILWLYGGKG